MSNSYKSYSTNSTMPTEHLEKKSMRERHEERRAWSELKTRIEHREQVRQLIQRWNELEDAKNNLGE